MFTGIALHIVGPIPVSASAMEVQNALNDLWTIKPDSVRVSKQELDTEALYNVTFNSNRGELKTWPLYFDWLLCHLTLRYVL